MASEIFTTAGIAILMTLLGIALGYGILAVVAGSK
ncbi:MAG: PetM family cytochrome b6-f complex subunit 7 [Thermostichales cyanobacterium SZTDM-1c_bins_54]